MQGAILYKQCGSRSDAAAVTVKTEHTVIRTIHVAALRVYTYRFLLHNPPNSYMDYGIFNVRTDVNAYDCAQECTDTSKSLH